MDEKERFDAIVIGSGIGGMTAAGLLSRLLGKRVLVLERHFELGGFTHVFRRGAYEWDVGLHYVGEMGTGGMARALMDYLTNGRLEWVRMPEVFERFVYPGLTVEEPGDPAAYAANLATSFPGESGPIQRYFRDVRKAARWHVRDFLSRFAPWYFGLWVRALNLPGRKRALRTTGAYLARAVTSERLRGVLASQWGDYGLPPAQSAFAIHALIVNHYLGGAYYPRGGASRIARLIEPIIQLHGGECRLSQDVQEIIVENGTAVGVRVMNGDRYFAPVIISDTGALNTFQRLLPASAAPTARRSVEALPPGLSAVTLYLGLSESPHSLGIQGENIWLNEDIDHDALEEQSRDLLAGKPRRCYLSFPSMKAGREKGDREEGGRERAHTAEIIALVSAEAFAEYKDLPWKQRAARYYELKDRISSGLLALVEKHVPGFTERVAYHELSTPLTIEHFSNRSSGAMYGLPATPQRYRTRHLQVKTPLRNLYLTGSDVSSLGILGAMMGGVATAARVAGLGGFFRIIAAARSQPPLPQEMLRDRPAGSFTGVVLSVTKLTETVIEIVYRIGRDISFVPGQYVRLRVGEAEWREYSVVELAQGELKLLVDTRSGGPGSRYVSSLREGDESIIREPLGDFRLGAGNRDSVFVATGTGIAPILPMLRVMAENGHTGRVSLYFGCRTQRDNILPRYTSMVRERLRLQEVICISREAGNGEFVRGRVTEQVEALHDIVRETDFYVSGNPGMTADVTRILRRKGAMAIFTESY